MPQGRGLEADLQRFAAVRLAARVVPILPFLLCSAHSLLAQRFEIGVEAGARLRDDIGRGSTAILTAEDESKRYIVGPMVGTGLPWRFSFEFDALYRRVGFTSQFNNPFPGFSSITRERANSWEFPMMVKRRLAGAAVQPVIGIGYAPRTVSGGPQSFSVTHGLVAAGGLNWNAGPIRVSPELRYVHWNTPFLNDFGPSYRLTSNQDEVFVLVGVSWH